MLFTRIPACFQGTKQDQERFPRGWWILPAGLLAVILWAILILPLAKLLF